MDEIKVGEYVRTKNGKIAKVINNNYYISEYLGCEKGIVDKENILKHSSNIIDLIEEGDFVNGVLVTGKESTLLYTDIKGIDHSGYHIVISQYGDGIKTILTHEQYERNCYRLEDN